MNYSKKRNLLTKLSGIYLHIPFCKQACAYCNFHFSTSLRYKHELLEALAQELIQEKNYLPREEIQTIYFGGGTPSLLSGEEVSSLLNLIRNNYSVAHDAEITLEANPDDMLPPHLNAWKKAGINRLSVGIQTFYDQELQWMNRAHNAGQSFQSIQHAKNEGFDNISIDLIYGSPLLDDVQWKNNIETALQLKIPHLSCYALTVEEKTPLEKQILTKHKEPVDPEKQARQFLLLMEWLRKAGYEHYEVSNFAQPGMRSRHNTSYWKGIPYLGIGPSAHSFKDPERRWNIASNLPYIRSVTEGQAQRETEQLTAVQQFNEFVMISLRTMEGINLRRMEEKWGLASKKEILSQVKKYQAAGWIDCDNETIRLTDEGMLRADGIASDLFMNEKAFLHS